MHLFIAHRLSANLKLWIPILFIASVRVLFLYKSYALLCCVVYVCTCTVYSCARVYDMHKLISYVFQRMCKISISGIEIKNAESPLPFLSVSSSFFNFNLCLSSILYSYRICWSFWCNSVLATDVVWFGYFLSNAKCILDFDKSSSYSLIVVCLLETGMEMA